MKVTVRKKHGKFSISTEKVSRLVDCYINELEEQEVMHVEIVLLLLDIFSKAELEKLGFSEFLKE